MDSDIKALERELAKAREKINEMQMERDHLIQSIPGGVAIYEVDNGNRFFPVYMSDGVPALTGYSLEEYQERTRQGLFDNIYEPDRARVVEKGKTFHLNGVVQDVSYRVRCKDGSLCWVRMNGRRIGPLTGKSRFFAVFTGMSEESRLFQNIANETADGIYVIDKESYELIYANESRKLFTGDQPCTGQKCYTALHGKTAPCEFCTLSKYGPDGQDHEIEVDDSDRIYTARFRETDWNGIPAYIQYLRDVTDEVKTRREKERLEMYFKTIVDSLPGGISVIRIDPDGRAVTEFISSGVATMTHMSQEETERLYANDICGGVHPDDVDELKRTMAEYLERGEGQCFFKGRMRLGEGGYIWVKSSVSMERSGDGVVRLYSVYTDISKTVEETERLRRQYEELIMQHYRTPGTNELVLGHCNITQNQIIEIRDFIGANLLEMLGDEREGFFKGLADFIVDEDERRVFLNTYLNEPALAAFARRDLEHDQSCFVKFPGQDTGCYVHIKMSLVESPETGDVTGVLTVTDITDSIMSQRVLDQLSVTTHDYIVDIDLLTDSYKVISFSGKAHHAPEPQGCHSARVAYMADNVVLEKDKELYTKALDADEIRRRLREENAYTVTYSMTYEDGEVRTKNMTVFAIDLRLERVCLVYTDITDSVRALENALALAKDASQAKSDFLTTMSHDIRTPMNAIMGMTTLALAYPGDRERVESCLQKIQVANKHLLSLVNDVLDMSRIERSKIAMNLRPLTLSGLVGELSSIIEPQARDAGLEFTVKKSISGDAFYGDSLRINQILINLLSNAVKFTPEGGRIELTAEELAPLEGANHVRYRFSVRDTGIGMSEEFINRLFDPFARDNTAMRIEGTGLGLSITKGLVDLMGGRISVDSRPNQGTVFQVELEFEIAEAPEVDGESHVFESGGPLPEKPFSGRTFLVAEDHPINAELICQLLMMDGGKAVVAADGVQTVRNFSENAPGTYDAILMDIQMPAMNGYDAARAIRELCRPDAKTIPIVAMTANAFAEDVQAALDAGMDAHVAKPIDVDVLRSTLGAQLKVGSASKNKRGVVKKGKGGKSGERTAN